MKIKHFIPGAVGGGVAYQIAGWGGFACFVIGVMALGVRLLMEDAE